MTEPEFAPEGIVAALARHRVLVVYIGGWAAALQGSPFPKDDVDITPESSLENAERLSAALTDLDARISMPDLDEGLAFAHDASSLLASRVWNLVTRFGRLDISFDPDGTRGYHDLRRDAVRVLLHGEPADLASLADIVRSKQAANRPKDQRVLPVLREILARADDA